ncbi:hypothetical protein ACFOG5_24480 [Pedobacter fastidiosus]|uniref:hypothetical protein n=1 Tax=Pedobacter fastidiosus TaxID=2765361 RepID=UPI003608B07B
MWKVLAGIICATLQNTERAKSSVNALLQKSDAYLFHLVKVAVGVEWKMSVKRRMGR